MVLMTIQVEAVSLSWARLERSMVAAVREEKVWMLVTAEVMEKLF